MTKQNQTISVNEYVARLGLICPFCRSEDIDQGPFNSEQMTNPCVCNSCGKDWDETYVLTGFITG